MTFTAALGSFSTTSGLLLGNNLERNPSATSTTLSLTVAPTQPPTVTNVNPPSTANIAVTAIDVTFSKLINLSTFTASRFTLTGPDGAISVQAPVLLSGDTYEIDFLSQETQGTYTYQIDSQVTDLVGNASYELHGNFHHQLAGFGSQLHQWSGNSQFRSDHFCCLDGD